MRTLEFLQRLRHKKGFTMIELIVVIAIIGVLLAVILPNISTDREKKNAADLRAMDFYSAVQHTVTKYMKYEGDLNIGMKTAKTDLDELIYYVKEYNGNFPKNEYTYIEMYTEQGEAKYVHAADTLKDLLDIDDSRDLTDTEKQLLNDIPALMDAAEDGYYFALVKYTNKSTAIDKQVPTVRVHSAYYVRHDLPNSTGDDDELTFSEDRRLPNGDICGVCSSIKDSVTNTLLGQMGTRFTNKEAWETATPVPVPEAPPESEEPTEHST